MSEFQAPAPEWIFDEPNVKLKEKEKESDEYILCAANYYQDGIIHVHQPTNIKMAYSTHYNLSIVDKEGTEMFVQIINKLRSTLLDAHYAFDENGYSTNRLKWYTHDQDMLEFSKEYPKEIFELSGTGDENTDLWTTYYKNGKMQHCPVDIRFDEYDETKLIKPFKLKH